MEEIQKKLDQTRANFHKTVKASNKDQKDAAWADYMQALYEAYDYNKINDTNICHTPWF